MLAPGNMGNVYCVLVDRKLAKIRILINWSTHMPLLLQVTKFSCLTFIRVYKRGLAYATAPPWRSDNFQESVVSFTSWILGTELSCQLCLPTELLFQLKC